MAPPDFAFGSASGSETSKEPVYPGCSGRRVALRYLLLIVVADHNYLTLILCTLRGQDRLARFR